MPRPRGSRFGDVTSAHIVRAELARIELRWILSSSAHIVRAEVDFSELSSHRASRIRRAPAPADPESARYQAPDGPLDGSSAGIATTLRDASSATDIDRAAGELPVLPWAAFGSPRPFHHSPVRGLARPPGAPRDEPSSTTRTRSHPGTSRRPQGRTCLSPACVRAGGRSAGPPDGDHRWPRSHRETPEHSFRAMPRPPSIDGSFPCSLRERELVGPALT